MREVPRDITNRSILWVIIEGFWAGCMLSVSVVGSNGSCSAARSDESQDMLSKRNSSEEWTDVA